jgi:hypothetical protein
MTATEWIRANLKQVFSMPDEACEWLCDLFDLIQVFDDFADGDAVSRDTLNNAIWASIVGMPSNPFFQRNAAYLLPHLGTAILKWQASDSVEREGKQNAMSFSWRASYYDVVLACVYLVHGKTEAIRLAPHVMALYGEKFDDYMKEFCNA